MSVTINGTNGLTFTDSSTQNTAATGFGFKNRIINGAMMIDQRNAGAAVTGGFPVDRFNIGNSTNGALSMQQNTSAPTGFTKSVKATITTAQTAGTGNMSLIQNIEGYNIADFSFGTAGASAITLSFWVRSSATGTFGGSLRNAAGNRSYPFSYTISSVDTWEQKSVTVAGDTTGTWASDNTQGMELRFSLFSATTQPAGTWYAGSATGANGQTQLGSTLNATWYITGVQLEKGSTATSFDYRPYGTELALCQRYYEKLTLTPLGFTSSIRHLYQPVYSLKTTMRATPTLDSGATYTVSTGSAGTVTLNPNATAGTSNQDCVFFWNTAANWSVGEYAAVTCGLSAEL